MTYTSTTTTTMTYTTTTLTYTSTTGKAWQTCEDESRDLKTEWETCQEDLVDLEELENRTCDRVRPVVNFQLSREA